MEHYVCNNVNKNCSSDNYCIYGKCVDCYQDDQCNSSFCINNNCVECKTNSQCPNKMLCYYNYCVICHTDADCRNNSNCGAKCVYLNISTFTKTCISNDSLNCTQDKLYTR